MTKKKNEEPKNTPMWLKVIKGFFRFLGRALVTVLSVFIISGCIIGCVLATVILGMVDDAEVVDLDQLELSYDERSIRCEHFMRSDALRAFRKWEEKEDKVAY